MPQPAPACPGLPPAPARLAADLPREPPDPLLHPGDAPPQCPGWRVLRVAEGRGGPWGSHTTPASRLDPTLPVVEPAWTAIEITRLVFAVVSVCPSHTFVCKLSSSASLLSKLVATGKFYPSQRITASRLPKSVLFVCLHCVHVSTTKPHHHRKKKNTPKYMQPAVSPLSVLF